ncbi:MAG: hypothetical protein ACR2NK_00035 [Mariniblastus sp.]
MKRLPYRLGDRRHLPAHKLMLWKISILALFIAAALAVFNIVAGTENWGPSLLAAALMFTVAAVLLVGPYIILCILAFFVRSHRTLSATLLVFILLVSVLGTTSHLWKTQVYLNRNKALPEGTDLGIFFVGFMQWMSTILLSCIVLPVYFYLSRRNRPLQSIQEAHPTEWAIRRREKYNAQTESLADE